MDGGNYRNTEGLARGPFQSEVTYLSPPKVFLQKDLKNQVVDFAHNVPALYHTIASMMELEEPMAILSFVSYFLQK